MRTAGEFFDSKIEEVVGAFKRPSMYCGSELSAQLYFGGILNDLSWIDERTDDDLLPVKMLLRANHGVVREQFMYQGLDHKSNFCTEIASLYAQAFYLLGYFSPERVLSSPEYDEVQATLDEHFFSVDHTQSEIIARFGAPSQFGMGGYGKKSICSYACSDKSRNWIYFDFVVLPPTNSAEEAPDPILRDVRRNRSRFEFLPYGKQFVTPWKPPPDLFEDADELDDEVV